MGQVLPLYTKSDIVPLGGCMVGGMHVMVTSIMPLFPMRIASMRVVDIVELARQSEHIPFPPGDIKDALEMCTHAVTVVTPIVYVFQRKEYIRDKSIYDTFVITHDGVAHVPLNIHSIGCHDAVAFCFMKCDSVTKRNIPKMQKAKKR